MKEFLIAIASAILIFLFTCLQRRFSSETLVDGFMDYEKAKELAPTVFKAPKKPDIKNKN